MSRPEPAATVTLPQALRVSGYRAALIANLGSGWALFGVRSSLIPLFVTEGIGASSTWVGVGFFVSAATQGALLLVAGGFADRVGRAGDAHRLHGRHHLDGRRRPERVAGGLRAVDGAVRRWLVCAVTWRTSPKLMNAAAMIPMVVGILWLLTAANAYWRTWFHTGAFPVRS